MHFFEQRLAKNWPPADWCDFHVVVAVSGGPDSVALLRALVAIRSSGLGRLIAAHFNHRLRGSESDADEQFVADLTARHGLEIAIGRAESPPASEEQARGARYAFLQSTAERVGARFVAVAHTADDQAETILHRILRGTGVAGLAGMRRVRPLSRDVSLIRPLLNADRTDITAYLTEMGQDYRLDATNADPRYTRNRIRNELLPLLARDYNPNIREALLRLGILAGVTQEVTDRQVDELYPTCVRVEHGQIEVDCRRFAKEGAFVVRELFVRIWDEQNWPQQAMGMAEWLSIVELAMGIDARAASNPLHLPGGVTAIKTGDQLVLVRPS